MIDDPGERELVGRIVSLSDAYRVSAYDDLRQAVQAQFPHDDPRRSRLLAIVDTWALLESTQFRAAMKAPDESSPKRGPFWWK